MEAVSRTQNKQGKLWKSIKEHKTLYLLMLPGLLYFVLFRYLPMFGLVIAFKNYNIFKGIWASDWVGLENFKELVHSADFWNVFKNTLVISLTKIVIGFPIPVLLAILLNEIRNIKFKRVTQTFIYLPHFLSWIIVTGILHDMLSGTGIINSRRFSDWRDSSSGPLEWNRSTSWQRRTRFSGWLFCQISGKRPDGVPLSF